ncbi:TetR/AcrR family transcriptional regulator [Mucilaginibacter sp. HD30]
MAKKTYQGTSNNKERSMQRLIDAVGDIIKTKGYTGLSASSIAKAAGLDRKLISLYFDSTDQLIETYVRQKDYWVSAANSAKSEIDKLENAGIKEIITTLLHKQLDFFHNEEEMQKLVIWQISEQSDIMFKIAEEREKLGTDLFVIADAELDKTTVDIRAVGALMVAGIYYLVLHSASNNTLFCEIDISTEAGRTRIKNAITMIIADTFKHANAPAKKQSS